MIFIIVSINKQQNKPNKKRTYRVFHRSVPTRGITKVRKEM